MSKETRSERPDRKTKSLHVLVVDDSAVVRQMLGGILSAQRGWTVTTAADALIALDKMKRTKPDVILLDLEMPRIDGLTFLKKVMAENPVPVVICSSIAPHGSEAALQAIEEGALEIVTKPKIGVQEFLEESSVLLVDALLAAAQTKPFRSGRAAARVPAKAVPVRPRSVSTGKVDRIVAIGASTGGVQAIGRILEAMERDCPPIVIVQHMPAGFSRAFAERLNCICPIEVKEAESGDRLHRGLALIAPGNRHMVLMRKGWEYAVEVLDGPLVGHHRPSVDVLFESVASVAGRDAMGIILTGMGEDGAKGLLAMKIAGSRTIAQDERSCTVYGMPKAAVERGAAETILSLSEIPSAITKGIS